jgi:hypothetical protein
MTIQPHSNVEGMRFCFLTSYDDSELSHFFEIIHCVYFLSYAIGVRALMPPLSFLEDLLKWKGISEH